MTEGEIKTIMTESEVIEELIEIVRYSINNSPPEVSREIVSKLKALHAEKSKYVH